MNLAHPAMLKQTSARKAGAYPVLVVNSKPFITLILIMSPTSTPLSLLRFPGTSSVAERALRITAATSGPLLATITPLCTSSASIPRVCIRRVASVATTASLSAVCALASYFGSGPFVPRSLKQGIKPRPKGGAARGIGKIRQENKVVRNRTAARKNVENVI